uniref:Reverse transcriptase zinc-binding domain-containing protein n=1 Tax=Sander lucioperca TaxID=283035 RepID=A0A8C9WZ36_SANLU
LARLKLKDSDTCWKCEEEVGTLVHILYFCKKNEHLWEGVVTLLTKIFNLPLIKSLALFLDHLLSCQNINIISLCICISISVSLSPGVVLSEVSA